MDFIIVFFFFGKIMPFKIQLAIVRGHVRQVTGFHSTVGWRAAG